MTVNDHHLQGGPCTAASAALQRARTAGKDDDYDDGGGINDDNDDDDDDDIDDDDDCRRAPPSPSLCPPDTRYCLILEEYKPNLIGTFTLQRWIKENAKNKLT